MNGMLKCFAMVIFFLTLTNCSNQNEHLEMPNEDKQSSCTMFNQLKEMSHAHSKGLDFCFNRYNSALLEKRALDFSRKRTNEFCINFATNESAFAICPETRSALNANEILSDTIVRPLSSNAEKMLESFMDKLFEAPNADAIYSYIQNLMETENFLSLGKEEQPFLLFMMLIGVDSAQYWSNPTNAEKWERLKRMEPTNETRGVAGPSASYWMTSEQIKSPNFKRLLEADMRGCGWSLLSGISTYGWMIGGIASSVDAALF